MVYDWCLSITPDDAIYYTLGVCERDCVSFLYLSSLLLSDVGDGDLPDVSFVFTWLCAIMER